VPKAVVPVVRETVASCEREHAEHAAVMRPAQAIARNDPRLATRKDCPPRARSSRCADRQVWAHAGMMGPCHQ